MKRLFGIIFMMGLAYSAFSTAVFAVSEKKAECVYLSSPLIATSENGPVSVVKLQFFLKTYEQFDVELSGVYDQKTIVAVHLFQSRYKADILAPWGLVKTTGDVSVTTLHKINEIYCGTDRVLSEREKAQMSTIRERHSLKNETNTASSTASSTNVVGINKEKPKSIPVGFMNLFALPILIMLFFLLPTQIYYMWGIAPHRKAQLIPRSFK